MNLPRVWGATDAEVTQRYGCDESFPDAPVRCVRAVSSTATPAQVFRWYCQLRVAPYSYDLLDNRGRRSPRTLTPGLEDLEIGQDVASIFTLTSFEPNRQLTLRIKPGRPRTVFGDGAMTYAVHRAGTYSRLIAVLCFELRDPIRRLLLPWGDLVMMRKQLRTIAALAASGPPIDDPDAGPGPQQTNAVLLPEPQIRTKSDSGE